MSEDLPDPTDPAVLAAHEAFMKNWPNTALELRAGLERGWTRAHILALFSLAGIPQAFRALCAAEIDYLLASGTSSPAQPPMTTVIVRVAP